MYIKGMNEDMTCRGFQFEVGKEYKIDHGDKPLELCSDTVFHFCDSLQKVHRFYQCDDKYNRFFFIEAIGEVITDDEKCGSDHIRIVREITGGELDIMRGTINGNTGLFNSGDRNSGYMNSGDRNSGDRNSGYMNSGYRNSGDRNSGDRNSGDRNSGYMNSGYRNSGDMNSGYRNSGDRNSGDRNSGYRNSGYRNSGDMNSGYRNSGDMNSGIANKCNFSSGVFCNESDMNIRIFNKPSGMSLKDFINSKYYDALIDAPFELTRWEWYSDEERAADEEKDLVGGRLIVKEYSEAWADWWELLSIEAKEIIQQIPNFDAEIFKDITGIDLTGETNE